jgi:hypothetical protein
VPPPRSEGAEEMADAGLVILTVAVFGLLLGLVRALERL